MKTIKRKKNSFAVDRSKWACSVKRHYDMGHGFMFSTALKDAYGYQCCLGFAIEQMYEDADGAPLDCRGARYPRHVGALEDLSVVGEAWNGVDSITDTELSKKAVAINDDKTIRPSDKERRLKALFRKHGIEVEFTGEGWWRKTRAELEALVKKQEERRDAALNS